MKRQNYILKGKSLVTQNVHFLPNPSSDNFFFKILTLLILFYSNIVVRNVVMFVCLFNCTDIAHRKSNIHY